MAEFPDAFTALRELGAVFRPGILTVRRGFGRAKPEQLKLTWSKSSMLEFTVERPQA